MRRLHLILVDLPPLGAIGDRVALRQPAPALAALLARGDLEPAAGSLGAALARALGVDETLPIAAHSLAREGQPPGDAFWMRADPVSLQFHQDQLVLVGPYDLAVRPDEADALTAAINAHFAAEGLAVRAPHPDRWYMRLGDEASPPSMPPLDAVAGRPVEPHLPEGSGAAVWRRRLNEIQMLLHDHPVNQAREASGQLPVNSLWFWGGGRHVPLPKPDIGYLAARHPLALALADAAGMKHGAADTPDRIQDEVSALVVLELPRGVPREVSLQALTTLDQTWFGPLLRRLRFGALRTLRIETTGGAALGRRLTPLATYRFWRRTGF